MRRQYIDSLDENVRAAYCRSNRHPVICEHCDCERSPMVRWDDLRGWVCPPCDSSLDAMYGRPSTRVQPR